jgi:hypothetical protein
LVECARAVDAASNATGVPANLIKAIMKLESNGLNLLPNGASAVGPMQVTINNWGYWAQTNGLNLYNADQNIMAGAMILDRFRLQYLNWSQQHGIDPWLTALYSYYAGNPYNLLSRDSPAHGGMGITTQEYGARIWYSYQFLQENWSAIAQAKLHPDPTLKANAGANPARAMDGDLNTTWTVTGNHGPPAGAYLQLDLGEPTRIFEISWVFRTTGYADRFRIRISNDGVNYETIHTVGNAPAKAWQYLLIDRSARYVRFNVDNPNNDPAIGYLAEVAVRGVKASQYVAPPAAAVPATLNASGGSSGATFTGRIRDGKLDTAWHTNGAIRPASASVYVDLGSIQAIGEISWIFSQTGGAPKLEIQVSDDKQSWVTIATAGNAAAGVWQRLQPEASGRYVRWLITNTTDATQLGYIAEVEVKTRPETNVPPTPTPTAAPTAPVHTLAGSGGSAGASFTGRIRDGKLDTDWRTTGAANPASGFVYIDLGSDQAIGTIAWVFSQSGGAPHLQIQVSNDKSTWTSVGSASDAPAGQWQSLSTAVTARYVRWLVINTSGAEQIGFIGEVRVSGPEPGTEPTATAIATATPEPTSTVPAVVDGSQLPGAAPLAVVGMSASGSGASGNANDGSLESAWIEPSSQSWLQADLGSTHTITHIAWLPTEAACAGNLTIQVSADGETWPSGFGYPTATAWSWHVATVEISGRYARWSFAGSGAQSGCLAEIRLWGSTGAPTPVATETPTEVPAPEIEPSATATIDVDEIDLPVEPTVAPTEAIPTEAPPTATAETTVESSGVPTAEPTVEPPAQVGE